MNLDAIEASFIKSLNAKLKALGGDVTITWKGGKIEAYSIKSENSGDSVYKGTSLDSPNKEVELSD